MPTGGVADCEGLSIAVSLASMPFVCIRSSLPKPSLDHCRDEPLLGVSFWSYPLQAGGQISD